MSRTEARSRTRVVCEECDNEVSRADEHCQCGAERPASGWAQIAHLRVYTSPPAEPRTTPPTLAAPKPSAVAQNEPDRVATTPGAPRRRAAPLAPKGPSVAGVYLRLFGTFGATVTAPSVTVLCVTRGRVPDRIHVGAADAMLRHGR